MDGLTYPVGMTQSTRTQDGGEILRRAFSEAAQVVRGTTDPGQAFEQATALVKVADEAVGDAAILRALMAQRLLREEGLSLAQLARRIGTSKSRADQLIRIASTAPEVEAKG
jgi:hypothetical protein